VLRCRSKLHSLRPFRIIDGTLHRVFAGPIGLRARPVGASSEGESQFHVIYEAEERFACKVPDGKSTRALLDTGGGSIPLPLAFLATRPNRKCTFLSQAAQDLLALILSSRC
jgi:hypothetical protein